MANLSILLFSAHLHMDEATPHLHIDFVPFTTGSKRGQVRDYERVKRAFGPEEVERAVEEAKRREAAEKEQRKAKRKLNRGAR